MTGHERDRIVRIGGASAFFLDSATAVPQLLRDGNLDYLIFDYLAEGSMAMFAALAAADPTKGYGWDFLTTHAVPHLRDIMGQGIRIVANAGGLNPRGLAAAVREAAAQLGLRPRIAFVEGDDLRKRADMLRQRGCVDMVSGAPLPERVGSLNAYLGALPIARALDRGADIVLTGRVVDSALVLGPLIHEFGWAPDDYDRLAAGTLAGHLLECGPQVTGGTFTDWRAVPDWAEIGYPIGECHADGSLVVTKPAGTGGLVSIGTVAEQLLYEVADPQCYFVPDVTCDFSAVTLEQVGPDRVRVAGARGLPPTASYKICGTWQDGWRATAYQPIIGLEAAAKAERQAAALLKRTGTMLRERNFGDWRRRHVELLGTEASQGERRTAADSREVICKIVVDHDDRAGAELFAREQASAISAMSVGTAIGFGTAVTPLIRLFSSLIDKAELSITLTVEDDSETIAVPLSGGFTPEAIERPSPPREPTDTSATVVPLIDLAWARSGDKGNLFNVAVIARTPAFLPYIRAALTPPAVAAWYRHFGPSRVDRYDVPGCHALNFVVHDALDGGINSSPRLDAAAKGMAQLLLSFPVPVSAALAASLDRHAAQPGPDFADKP